MLRKIIHPSLILPLSFFITSHRAIISETNNYLNEILVENEDNLFINHDSIEEIILNNNQELKSLKELITSSEFNVKSQISRQLPTFDLQVNGLPKYTIGKNYNSNAPTTKTSQFTVNPALNLKLDLIDPVRKTDIKIASINYEIAKNNYEIKKKDLIQEAKARYHRFQKSQQEIINKQFALDLSVTSLKDAKSKLSSGIGTKFEVLEAEAQLSRDTQALNEKKIEHKINKNTLKEILNIKKDFNIEQSQNLTGFWKYKLNKNINDGLEGNLSLKNILLNKSIKQNQAKNFLNLDKPKVYISNSLSTNFTKGDASSISIDPSESGSTYTNSISLNLNWGIFNGSKNKNMSKSSESEAIAEKFSYTNSKNILKTNISKAYLNLNLNQQKIISSLKDIASTKESLRLSRLRYDVGIATLKDVLIRQKELSNANSKKIDAIYNYNLNLDELERLTSLEISKECLDNEISKKQSICNI